MKKISFWVLCAACFLLSACGPAATDPTPTASVTIPPTATATKTLAPTGRPIPTYEREPTDAPVPTPTPIPAGSEILSVENIAQIELLDWHTYGSIMGGFYILDGEERIGYVFRTQTHIVGFSQDGEQLYTLPAPTLDFFRSGFGLPSSISKNHRYLSLRVGESYAVVVYDLLNGEKIQTLDHLVNFPNAILHQNPYGESNVQSISFNDDGSLLAAAYEDATISVWDVRTGKEYSLPSTFEYVSGLAFSQDSEFLAISSGWSGKLSLYSIDDIENMALELVQTNVGTLVQEPFSIDGKYLLTMEIFAQAPKYAIFDLDNMTMIRRAGAPGYSPRFFTDGSTLIFSNSAFEANAPYIMVDIETGQILEDQNLERLQFSDENEFDPQLDKFLISQGYYVPDTQRTRYDDAKFFRAERLLPDNGAIKYWSQGYSISFAGSPGQAVVLEYWLDGNVYEAFSIQTGGDDGSYEGQLVDIIAPSGDAAFYCWVGKLYAQTIPMSGEPTILAENCGGPEIAAYDPNHNLVAYPIDSRIVDIIDAETGELKFHLGGYNNKLGSLRFSGDGNWLMVFAVRPDDYNLDELMLFSLNHENGRADPVPLTNRNTRFREYILDVDLADDGGYMLAGIGEMLPASSKVNVWNFTGQGARLRTIYTKWPNAIALSRDHQILAAVSAETLYFYSIETSDLLAEYRIPNDWRVGSIIFSPDGKSFLMEASGAVAVWGVP